MFEVVSEVAVLSDIGACSVWIETYASSPFSNAANVRGPNTPSATNPDLDWNSLIAFFVILPFIPSIAPL